ncbi:unnamed protein product, partial [Rotaria sordida]
ALLPRVTLSTNSKWIQNGVTVAGGNGAGSGLHQLYNPWALDLDHNRNIYIAEYSNHRIVEWKCGATIGRIVAGGNGPENDFDQLSYPTNIIIDRQSDSFIISDFGNKRIVRWPRSNGTNGETIISNIRCYGLAMDDNGFLYVSDWDKHEVRRYRIGENQGTIVAGGNGAGNRLDQLNYPISVFVDQAHLIYTSDYYNHRVMKWIEGSRCGIVVAGGRGQGNSFTQLSNPRGIVVDQSGNIYVADESNYRIVRWSPGATQGSVIVGGYGQGSLSNQLSNPMGLSFDREGNLYVNDTGNHRVQKFNIDQNL